MTRVLFISLAAGSGHVQAAAALEKTAAKSFPNLITKHLEMSEYLPTIYRAGLVDSYHSITKYSPRFWSYIYRLSNTERFTRFAATAITPTKFMGSSDFYQAIEDFKPDHIICTNSVPAYFRGLLLDEKAPPEWLHERRREQLRQIGGGA
jgi:processive 1,2-diacylglycerol beta-glucosyltransferase